MPGTTRFHIDIFAHVANFGIAGQDFDNVLCCDVFEAGMITNAPLHSLLLGPDSHGIKRTKRKQRRVMIIEQSTMLSRLRE